MSTTSLNIPDLLGRLALEEKASLLDGADFWHLKGFERFGIPEVMVTDGPHGLRKQVAEADHAGLNDSVPATCFPPAAGLASTWDVDLLRRVGVALGDECRAAEVGVLLGPGVNMKRSPLCGRNFEYLSEDPLLAGELAAALTAGIQERGVGVSVKHFAANNQETDRMTISAEVDERTLREIYLPAFERVVTRAEPWTVMCSYNRVNGVYTSENRWLLTEILRTEWGYDGVVVSDWGAVSRRDAGLAAGLDLEMPSSSGAGTTTILEAVRAGTLSEEDVDRAAGRVLGLIDKVLPALSSGQSFDADAHHALAREAAAESCVLLKNTDDLLPLDPASGGAIAVIGEFARSPRYQGAGSSQVNPTRLDTALESIERLIAGRRPVVFAAGYTPDSDGLDEQRRQEAVDAAAGAEVAVVFLGLPAAYESEGYDREHMDLPGGQVELLHAVAEVNSNLVVVLANGSAVTLAPWQDRAKAVLEGWLLGQAGGSATADLLFGERSPSGRLAESLPLRYEDNPTIGNFPGEDGHVRYGEGLLIGYRWYDAHRLPVAYPFGHGLSYTTFDYSDLVLDIRSDGETPQVDVTLSVTNSGTRAAKETVQVYVADPESSVYRPEQELRAFAQVALGPGESRSTTLTLDARAFAFWHPSARRWIVEEGDFEIRAGASSRDIRLRETVRLAGHRVVPPLTVESTADAFLAHPDAGPWLREAVRGTYFDDMLMDLQNGRMMRAIPLQRLSRFPGAPVSEQQVQEAVRRFG